MNYLNISDKKYSDKNFAKNVILNIPYDNTSTWIKGADKAPKNILEASAILETYDIETKSSVYKTGIYTDFSLENIADYSPEDMVKIVENKAKEILDENKFLISLGGEHSVSIGLINAFVKKFDDITIVQFDAHTDLRDSFFDSKYNHACVMRRAMEKAPILQLGIRSMEANEPVDYQRTYFAHDIVGKTDWIEDFLKKLTKNVYLTIDVDGLDPSVMPATGTPEPGGFSWYELLNIIKKINMTSNIVGCDIVELCPQDSLKHCDFLVAKLVYKILSYINSK